MKYSVQKGIEVGALPKILPKRFRGLFDPRLPKDETCTILLFSGERVICSSQLSAALEEPVDADQIVLAYAYNLTEECKQILRERGVQVYTERDWHWTDESYSSIRNHRSERKL